MGDGETTGDPAPPPAESLHIEVEGRSYVVPPGEEWLVGRGSGATIRLTDTRISRRHAFIRRAEDGWRLVDAPSANGLYQAGERVAEVVVDGELPVVLGGRDGVPMLLRVVHDAAPAPPPPSKPEPPQPQPPTDELESRRPPSSGGPALSGVHRLPSDVVTIGRSLKSGIVLSDLMVSRRHAEVRRTGAGVELVDLSTGNGTFVNGHRIDRSLLRRGDLVTIGRHALQFDGTQLVEYVDTGDVSFAASDLVVALPDGKRLLDRLSFNLPPRTLMAIVGPSGAGKSTLLGALTGFRPATSGRVHYAGRDLYAEYDELRQRIGLVPQQDIVHTALTVRQALEYGAQLRFPADVTPAERSARVTEVIGELSLTLQSDTRISSLSGGERKRASTALELLTKPSLLFLDEPTSGLDTDLDREVMSRLRILADEGRTVVVVTHNLQHLQACDVVMVLARGGHVAYLGPPSGAFAYFGVDDWADLFGRLKTRDGPAWAADFGRYAGRDARAEAPPPLRAGSAAMAELTPVQRQSVGSQFRTLCSRYLAVTASDRMLLSIIGLLPIILAVFARVVPAPHGLAHRGAVNLGARQLLLVLAVGAALMGSASAVRELVKERAIYQRERAIGLSDVAYVGSKVAVLSAVAVLQGIVLTLLALAGRPPADSATVLGSPTLEIVIAIATLSAVSAVIGLVISAAVRDENQAMPLLVIITMAQLVLCGGLVPVAGRAILEQLGWLTPARWGFAAAASTADVNGLERQAQDVDGRWAHDAGTWLTNYSLLLLIGVAAAAVLGVLVRRLDPDRR